MRNEKYKVAIIDDDSVCIDNLHRSIGDYSELSVVGSTQSTIIGNKRHRDRIKGPLSDHYGIKPTKCRTYCFYNHRCER